MNTSITNPLGHVARTPDTGTAAGASLARWLWSATLYMGQRRAANHLDRLAQRYGLSDPALARQLRQAAQECRAAVKGGAA